MIRKVIATVIISLVTLNYIQAQDKFKRELSLGASFGTTFSKVSFAQTKVQQKIKMGYTGGRFRQQSDCPPVPRKSESCAGYQPGFPCERDNP